MRKLKDVLRLKLSGEQSHHALGIAKGSVTKCRALAAAAALDWGTVELMSQTDLQRRLCVGAPPSGFVRPDYGRIHQELRRKSVTLMLLWQEYSAQVGDEHSSVSPSRRCATPSSA